MREPGIGGGACGSRETAKMDLSSRLRTPVRRAIKAIIARRTGVRKRSFRARFAASEKVLNRFGYALEVAGPYCNRGCNGGWLYGDETIGIHSDGFDTVRMPGLAMERTGTHCQPVHCMPMGRNLPRSAEGNGPRKRTNGSAGTFTTMPATRQITQDVRRCPVALPAAQNWSRPSEFLIPFT